MKPNLDFFLILNFLNFVPKLNNINNSSIIKLENTKILIINQNKFDSQLFNMKRLRYHLLG